jgi:hypothetical protein
LTGRKALVTSQGFSLLLDVRRPGDGPEIDLARWGLVWHPVDSGFARPRGSRRQHPSPPAELAPGSRVVALGGGCGSSLVQIPSRAAYSAAWLSFGRHRAQTSVRGDSMPRQPLSSRWPLRHRLIRRHRSGASRRRATGCRLASPTRTSGGMSCLTVFVQRTGRPSRRTRQCRARCWPQRLNGVRRAFIAAADWLQHSGLSRQGEVRSCARWPEWWLSPYPSMETRDRRTNIKIV